MPTKDFNAEKHFQLLDQLISGVNLRCGRLVMRHGKLVIFYTKPFTHSVPKGVIACHVCNTGAEFFGFATNAKICEEHDADYTGVALSNVRTFLTNI